MSDNKVLQSVSEKSTVIPGMADENNRIPVVETNYSGIFVASWENIQWVGMTIFEGMESIGEVVSNVLGLNESRVQYVIDGMTEDDWDRAIAIKNQREEMSVQRIQANHANEIEAGIVEN